MACMFSRLDPARLLPVVSHESLTYETPVASEEDLPSRVMAMADGGARIGDHVYQNMAWRYRICVDVGGHNIEPFLYVEPDTKQQESERAMCVAVFCK